MNIYEIEITIVETFSKLVKKRVVKRLKKIVIPYLVAATTGKQAVKKTQGIFCEFAKVSDAMVTYSKPNCIINNR